ncbi:MAG: SRPBCC family protein [Bacteroidota bacterium]|nr:SRPBCC family protein [Bacteroidota bacterium]
MKILKIIGIVVGGIILLFFVAALIIPKSYNIERSIVINTKKDNAKAYLLDFKNFDQYSPWAELDPNMSKNYEGTPGAVGSKYSWKGNDKVGSGSMEIVNISDNLIEEKLTFIEPFQSVATSYFTFTSPDTSSVTIVWGMKGENPIPFNVMGKLMNMDAMIGKDYEKGLAKLKTVLETPAQ